MNNTSPSVGPTASSKATAAVVIIGEEILSGRTQDTNLGTIARFLGEIGIPVKEARVVGDVTEEIAEAVNTLRARYTYLFTTGGIGPTHDDITADSIGFAFGVPVEHHPDALAILDAHYRPGEFNEARRRMARVPRGGTLIDNPISKAPGFQIGNVFVMAGIPRVMAAMLVSLRPRLTGGAPLLSHTLSVFAGEGTIADTLSDAQAAYPDVAMGSYPFYRQERYGTSLVLRADSPERLQEAAGDLALRLSSIGITPVEGEIR